MTAVLRTGMLVQGAFVRAFEEEVARRAGRAHGVAVSSGTAALALVFEALELGPGDEVLCPALSWPSPAHAAQRRGAKVTLVDVDPREWNATAADFAPHIGPKTKALIAIDQFGNPVRAAELETLAQEHGLTIVEDAACSLGASLAEGRPGGNLGVASTFSFHPRKVLTTGEGGVIVTDDVTLDERLRWLRNHGQMAPGMFAQAAENFRLTELQGILGAEQMKRLDTIVAQRRRLRARMAAAIEAELGDAILLQHEAEGARSNWQTFGVVLAERFDQDAVIDALRERGVGAGLLSYDIAELGTITGPHAALPHTAHIAAHGIALPLFPQMSDDDADQVVAALLEVLR